MPYNLQKYGGRVKKNILLPILLRGRYLRYILFLLATAFVVVAAVAGPTKNNVRPLVKPEINADSWVMIEIWPEVNDITLSAYFLDYNAPKNKSLCQAVKIVFDRDQQAREKQLAKKFTSYRRCLSVEDAKKEGLVYID